VPSAGCRHPFETYLAVFNVKGLEKGIYRYLPLNNSLICEKKTKDLKALLIEASLGQDFTGHSALCFIWTALPYRTEWRYGPVSHKVIAIDAGHLCQNLYLSCAAVGCGTCAIAAYDQKKMDDLLGVDGDEEFTVYLAPVGKIDFGKEV
jgi:SagB-type dehydrogenase family enzyme